MIKHLARHNNKKVAILYRKVPGEDHMCLVAYFDNLPRHVETALSKTLRSAAGQAASNLADALFQHVMSDGQTLLGLLHKEGFMKKINTNQTIVTPIEDSNQNSIRLDELNKVIDSLEAGTEAAAKLAELDKRNGMLGNMARSSLPVVSDAEQTTAGVLSDADLASMNLAQAATMRRNAENMLAEAARLESEAAQFIPSTDHASKETAAST